MQITFLGTGTSQGIPVIGCTCNVCTSKNPKDKRLRCSILITYYEKNYVIDVGPDFRTQMLRADVRDLDCVFITHEHNDHIIGLDDLRPFIFMHNKEIEIYGLPRVLAEIKERFHYAFQFQPYPGAPKFELKELNPGEKFKRDSFELEALQVFHGPLEILGFKLQNFAYLTDVKTLPSETIEKIKGIKVLVISALRKAKPHHSHLILDEALQLIKEIQPDKAYLIHLSHLMGKHNEVSKELPDYVEIAYDGLQLDLLS